MSASTTYTPLRDDTSYRSISNNEQAFLRSCATGVHISTAGGSSNTQKDGNDSSSRQGSVLRTDGRQAGESRPIRMSFGRSHNTSECTVQFGATTRVTSAVTCQLVPPPHADRPNDGTIGFSVDLSPMCAMGFEYVQPSTTLTGGGSSGGGGVGGSGMGNAQDDGQKLLSNRILRILERTLLNGGAIDAEALCVQSGKWVWRLTVDVTVLDHGGNLVDACILSAVAALRHFRKAEVDVEDDDEGMGMAGGADNGNGNGNVIAGPVVLHSDEKEPTPLPLHHTPLTVTFALYADPSGATTSVSALIDPSHREELVMDGNTTFSFNKYGEMCSLDFPGGCELKPRQLVMCATLGKRKCVELCNILETSLEEADLKAVQERLDRLKLVANNGSNKIGNSALPLPDIAENVPFVERTNYDRDGDLMEVDGAGTVGEDLQKSTAAAIAAAEEESYRIQALDYSLGHVAAKVKENDASKARGGKGSSSGGGRKGPIFGGSLMAAMLKSANTSGNGGDNNSNSNSNETNNKDDDEFESDLEQLEIKSKRSKPSSSSSSTRRTKEVDEKAAKRQQSTQTAILSNAMAIDSDDEEETTTLQHEFGTLSSAAEEAAKDQAIKQKSSKTKTRIVKKDEAEDDVDDLAMAIKKKPSKGKKKKKAKK